MPICIAGMHRSGTSMVARLLNLCGLYLGEPNELPGPLGDNLEGHWENTLFRSLNDRLLAHLGGAWDLPPALASGWEESPDLRWAHEEARHLVERFGAHGPWGWKDPRNSLTLPFWRSVLPDLKVVICLRNPLEVAESLRRRGSFSQAFALHLWLTYNQRALSGVPPRERVVTEYGAYFLDPEGELRRVLGLLGLTVPDGLVEGACTAVHSSLRHNHAVTVPSAEGAAPAVVECYEQMLAEAGPVWRSPLPPDAVAADEGATFGRSEGPDWREALRLLLGLERRDDRERLVEITAGKTAASERTIQALSTEASAQEQTIQGLTARLLEIRSRTAWRVTSFLCRVRLALAPRDSRRERMLRLGKQAARVARRNGFAALLRKAGTKLARQLSASGAQAMWVAYVRTRPVGRAVLPDTWRRIIGEWARRRLGLRAGGMPLSPIAATSWSEQAIHISSPAGYDVICFPIIEWEHRYQRPQQLASKFAEHGHRVFYLSLAFHGQGDTVQIRQVAERIYVIQLPGPADLNRFRERLPDAAGQRCLRALEGFCLQAGIHDAVCLVQLPFWTTLALALREQRGWKVIFDCMDEHSGLTILEPDLLEDEAELARKADLVLVSSHKLWEKHAPQAVRCQRLPNATDYDHFSRPGDTQALGGLPRPIIGYYGAIMEWFDVPMLAEAARARPAWSFVLIGNVDNPSAESLRKLANVHLLGEQPYSRLPSFLHGFDVCLIPFRLTPIIESTNPVKFYEYLSASKPVVSVPMPELLPLGEFYYPARNGMEVVMQAEKALREDGPERQAARRAWASQQTWQARYESLAKAIDDLHAPVSIIVASYNGLEHIRACLESVFGKTQYPRYEVIVVDNASTPEVVRFLQQGAQRDSRLRVILNRENLGFARANNIGLEAANPDSEYLVLLNNDTVVTPGWLATLLHWLRDPSIGLVGPVTCPSGAANEAAVPAGYANLGELDAFAQGHAARHRDQSFDIPMLAMYCVAMRRAVYQEVGPLDEDFGIGMFEDDDYSLRVRNNGYRVVCAEDVFIHHTGRASLSRLEDAEHKALFERNRQRFERKWNVQWQRPAGR